MLAIISQAIDSDDLPLSLLPGYIYEQLLADPIISANRRKKEAVFYTPTNLIQRMLTEVKSYQTLENGKVLDPSCGSGTFLVLYVRNALDFNAAFEKIYGIDKDPLAVSLTRFALLYEATVNKKMSYSKAQAILENNIICANSLFDLPKQFDGFDLIIGNPPYGLSRDQQISSSENEELKDRYSCIRAGKLNKYMLFMYRSFELLKDNGVLSLVVPNSWLGIKSAHKLRKLFLALGVIRKISLFEQLVFDDPGFEATTFIIQRNKAIDFDVSRYKSHLDLIPVQSCKVKNSFCLSQVSNEIPTRWSNKIQKLVEHLRNESYLLSDPLSPFHSRIALQAYATGKGNPPQSNIDVKKRIYDQVKKESKNSIPYLKGSDIKRYRIEWSKSYLNYGPWLAEPQKLSYFSGPRVLVREITNHGSHALNAAYTDQTFLYNKSVLHILPKNKNCSRQLMALTALLNSSMSSFFFAFLGKKTQRRLFPKVVNQDLKEFPIPREFERYQEDLASCVEKIIENPDGSDAFQEEINDLSFKCYNLDKQLILDLKESLITIE